MTIFRILTFTIISLFFIVFSRPPASAIVPSEVNRVECADISQIPLSECNALVAFYEKMDGIRWENDENWRKTDDPCGEDRDLGWYGIACQDGHVTKLRLVGTSGRTFGLVGDLAPEIGELSYLKEIDFTYNDLTTLPAEIGKLQNLEVIYLSHNYLEELPAEIGKLSSLVGIYLCWNELKTVPAEIGDLSNLKNLYFDHNKLSEVPAEVGNLSNVETVRFNHNKLTTLPAEIGYLPKLKNLYINHNHLTTLPGSFARLILTALDVGHNHLKYAISYELENWLNTYDPDWRDTQTYPPTSEPKITPTPTTVPTSIPVGGDQYELDDSCQFARTLDIDASPQSHTFHKVQDEDWLQVDLQEGVTYKLLASGTNRDAQPEIEVHSDCGTQPEASGPAFGNDNELIFTASASASYYIKIWNSDVNIFGQDITYDVSITASQPAGDVAIIVTGRDGRQRLQQNIYMAANRAYKVFSDGGISKDRIRYLGIEDDSRGDVDDDGKSEVDTHATLDSTEEAIRQWPIGKVNGDSRIFIYLMGHGLEDYMIINGGNSGEDEVLRAEVLDDWLDQLEADTGASIIVIYEACRAGSFITGQNSISKPGRVIIASTDDEHNAYPVLGSGAHFSDAFFSALRWGKDFYTAFDIGRNASVQTIQLQRPLLDDNGDHKFTIHDGTLTSALKFPAFTSPDRPESVPALRVIQSRQSIANDQGVIQVQASNAHYVKMVWADIYPPDYVEPETSKDGVAPMPSVDRIELSDNDGDGIYEGTYDKFDQDGNYRIVFYGHDMEGDAIMSISRNILVEPDPIPMPPNSKVYLPVVTR